ncbi:Chlororespiratory reduction 42 [Heracleum sosnowskyi]|uniref:Chlororespiratory reduction 42 n=1 Tax=Heracleum sosnowskyi TaxID=360622 RepID=A0AAD8GUD5_9APIA|nr:Chlororespiratory reduction 42 [Heracleum sosnowskyi]
MAMCIFSIAISPYEQCSRLETSRFHSFRHANTSKTTSFSVKCEQKEDSIKNRGKETTLKVGSPIIVIEAPKMLKTAASVPCLRTNSGLVNPGDVGRIVSRKPKDVWAIRLSIGTYLIDERYFKPLELEEE